MTGRGEIFLSISLLSVSLLQPLHASRPQIVCVLCFSRPDLDADFYWNTSLFDLNLAERCMTLPLCLQLLFGPDWDFTGFLFSLSVSCCSLLAHFISLVTSFFYSAVVFFRWLQKRLKVRLWDSSVSQGLRLI